MGLSDGNGPIVSNFPCTGMHGGRLYLRGHCAGIPFPEQVTARTASPEDMREIEAYLREYCALLDFDFHTVYDSPYTVVTPDSNNPDRQMYVEN